MTISNIEQKNEKLVEIANEYQNSTQELKVMTDRLAQIIPVSCVHFTQFNKDGGRIFLSTDARIIWDSVVEHQDFAKASDPFLPRHSSHLVTVYDVAAAVSLHISSCQEFFERIKNSDESFGYGVPVTVLIRNNGTIKQFTFSPRGSEVGATGKIYHAKDHLFQFAYYYLAKMNDKLNHLPPIFRLVSLKHELPQVSPKDLFPLERVYLHDGVYLTKKEAQCASFIADNRSAEEIGLMMGISRRTAEHYIARISEKAGFLNKRELQPFLSDMGFSHLHF